jgi:threonine dehydratase
MQTIELRDVEAAARRIAGHVHRTPVLRCSTVDLLAGREVFFKCEMFQKTGAFKIRGACNAVLSLDRATAKQGLLTHSSGNHGQALAAAARLVDAPAWVVMPAGASAAKRRAIEGYGATVVECEWTVQSRLQTLAEVQARQGGTVIPPFDHPAIIAGQGTVALELLEEVPDLDAIVAPIGGGGLISGIAVAARGRSPGIRIIGAEPADADDARRSKELGQRQPPSDSFTIADGLRGGLGEHTWPIIRDQVDQVVTVSEQQIIDAMRLLWERAKLLAETNAAVALAALFTPELRWAEAPHRVGVVLSGGNVDLDNLPWAARSTL